MKYIGIDCHKEFCVASVVDDAGHEVESRKFATKKEAILEFLKGFDEDKANVKLVLEATVRWRMVHDIIRHAGFSVKLAHPMGVRLIAAAKVKTDKVDANALANLLRMDWIPEAHIASDEAERWRKLVRHRYFLTNESTTLKNRIRSEIREAGIDLPKDLVKPFSQRGKQWLRSLDMLMVSDLLDCLDVIEERIRDMERIIEDECLSNRDARRLSEVPGIGTYTALTLVAEIDGVDRFPTPESLCRYFGLVPSVSQSGGHCSHGPITKQGSPMVRFLLLECANVHVNCCPESKISQFFRRKEKEIGRQKAAVAAARKLLVAAYFMLKRDEPFRGPGSDLGI
jgi:transposase